MMRRHWLIGLGLMTMLAGCDVLGMGGDGSGGPGMSGSSGGTGGTGAGTGGLGGSGNLPPATTSSGTAGCMGDDTGADPWGDGDGCGGGLPTSSPWDLGNGGSCWAHLQHWDESCEAEPCLDYDCHSPSLCGPVTFGECGGGTGGGTGDGGVETTGGPELEVDDPAALECILEALRDRVAIEYTIIDCASASGQSTTYEVVSNGLVITTFEEAYGDSHSREQQIATFNDGFDFDACVGPAVSTYEKQFCVGMAAGTCPIGPVACPAE